MESEGLEFQGLSGSAEHACGAAAGGEADDVEGDEGEDDDADDQAGGGEAFSGVVAAAFHAGEGDDGEDEAEDGEDSEEGEDKAGDGEALVALACGLDADVGVGLVVGVGIGVWLGVGRAGLHGAGRARGDETGDGGGGLPVVHALGPDEVSGLELAEGSELLEKGEGDRAEALLVGNVEPVVVGHARTVLEEGAV